jgi:hypothetical protein
MRTLPLLAAVVLLALPSALPAQKKKKTNPPADQAKQEQPKAPAQPAQPDAPKESPRLQKLKSLSFDRRPSAILKAWAPAVPETPKENEKDKKPDPLDLEMKTFQRHVTLGKWDAVKAYLAGLPEDEAKAGYKQLLTGLQRGPAGGPQPGPMMMGMPPGVMQYQERNQFSPDDLVGLAAAAPKGLDKESLAALGGIAQQAISGGIVVEALAGRFKEETAKPAGAALTSRQAAKILNAAGQAAELGPFLPPVEQAQAEKDLEAVNLLARHFLGLHAKDKKLAHLEKAWAAIQASLATAGPRADHEEALRIAVELAPKLKDELGQAWLDRSFTEKPERGMDILATVGTLSANGLATKPHDTDGRFKALKLQKTAVDALLKAAPERAREWRETLTLLAGAWLKEAEFTRQFAQGSGAARMRRDMYGNFFFVGDDDDGPNLRMMMQQNPNMPRPVSVVDVLKAGPDEAWLDAVRDDLRPKLAILLCQLRLKADEERKAFPYIERLAGTHKLKARELTNEFLRVWTRNHDPNAARAYTNPYMFMYGFEQRANGIPLTRSKQERNLDDLADWVARLKKLDIGDPDEELLAKAFTSCHSTAEVYRMEAIEKVFGPLAGLKPRTLSGLAQKMRENLAGVWREPKEQGDKKTNRKTKDIQAEVLRGYGVALEVVNRALKQFPDDWSLTLANAAILHDELTFHQELGKSTKFAPKRTKAYAEFQKAADRYRARVLDLTDEEQSTKVYEQWFYASLGACDLGHITEEKLPDLKQPALIRKALQALPGEAAERHRARFANALFTRLSAVKPAVKFRYLQGGFEIVGDHEQAAEARKVFDYYKDLVREIKLEAVPDGSDVVGHKRPFGVLVRLRHTRDIERESGGFGRYLQNQNTSTRFSWNYGRPTADYRDRFQSAATEALKEHFEVLSVTFETDKVHSRAAAEYGWRITPYAYLLLKARGPQVDKLPPLRIDLDFLDTSGYVVLPIESPAVALDARPEKGEPRPARKLHVTQTLDERQADQGKLILEVKVTALGLVPELDRILTLAPDAFDIVKTDDQGVSVAKFEPESDPLAVGSERTWLVTLQAKPDQGRPEGFHFGKAKADDTEMAYRRYEDADLKIVGAQVELEERYGGPNYRWVWWAAGAGLVVSASGLVLVRRLRRRRAGEETRWVLPEPLTPFTVIGLLERMRHEGRLNDAQRTELQHSIRLLERHFFAAGGNGDGCPDLQHLAESWIRQVC